MAEPRGRDVEQQTRTQKEPAERPRQQEITRRSPTGLDRGFGDPFSMMHALHREMDRMFENFGFGSALAHSPFFGREMERSMWSPEIEMFEKDGKIHISADLPGLDKNDVKVDLHDNVLTIEGERRSEKRDEKGAWSERSYGRFFRQIPLPENVNAETANAKFENGVLDITIDAPRQQQPRGKSIQIK